jgi:pantothenate synthetase
MRRAAAPVIYRALQMAESMIEIGERDPQAVIRER